jgi:hypothetical protein
VASAGDGREREVKKGGWETVADGDSVACVGPMPVARGKGFFSQQR